MPKLICTYRLLNEIERVESSENGSLDDFKDGFWINASKKFTTDNDGFWWIPPSQIIFVSKRLDVKS